MNVDFIAKRKTWSELIKTWEITPTNMQYFWQSKLINLIHEIFNISYKNTQHILSAIYLITLMNVIIILNIQLM